LWVRLMLYVIIIPTFCPVFWITFVALPHPTTCRPQVNDLNCWLMVWWNQCLTIDDILNVRLQTLGVAEHRYNIMLGGVHYNWLMYDVGGAVSFVLLHCVLSHALNSLASCFINREEWCVLLHYFASHKGGLTLQYWCFSRDMHGYLTSMMVSPANFVTFCGYYASDKIFVRLRLGDFAIIFICINWHPFKATAIIFLAPISAFDQVRNVCEALQSTNRPLTDWPRFYADSATSSVLVSGRRPKNEQNPRFATAVYRHLLKQAPKGCSPRAVTE
jgi:hypothetical protein